MHNVVTLLAFSTIAQEIAEATEEGLQHTLEQ